MPNWHVTRVTKRLGITYPIIQGPFGGGASSPALAAAVSNAGGLGSYGLMPTAPAEIAGVVRSIRALTKKPFAMNLWVSGADPDAAKFTRTLYDDALAGLRRYFDELGIEPPAFPPPPPVSFEDQARALLDADPPVFSFVFGIPPAAILRECHDRKIPTIGTVTTAAEARAMEEAGVDVIVASGFEAGGHRGSFLASAEESLTGTFALVPQVADAVRVPVIAAGGIADARGIAAARMLGAEGVQIGTAFLACEESNASPLHRSLLFSDAARLTALTRRFSGRLGRAIRNQFVDDSPALPYPLQGWLLRPVLQAAVAQGRTDLPMFWAGQGAHLVRHHHAADLLAALVSETSLLLGTPRTK